jgi:hypothetical protein
MLLVNATTQIKHQEEKREHQEETKKKKEKAFI